jgi:hypothetical protein
MPDDDDVARRWAQGLESDDEATVIRALHAACPCTGSASLYESSMPVLLRFKKDARPAVRAVAIHLEIDALEQLAIADEQANGFRRNRPGGNGRRRESRKAEVRHGFRRGG